MTTQTPTLLEHAPRLTYRFVTYIVIIALSIGLRAWTGPWYHLYNPADARVIDGVPATWEVVYFAPHIASFTSSSPPRYGFAPVQTRAFVPLAIAAALTPITNHVGISLFLVELFGWIVACVATARLGECMGLSPLSSFCGGILVATSPLFTSQLGMLVFHPAEFASLPVGLLAVTPLLNRISLNDRLSITLTIRHGVFLGIVLTILSLSYVYHWALFYVFFSVLAYMFLRLIIQHLLLIHYFPILSHFGVVFIGVVFFSLSSMAFQKLLVSVGLPPLVGEITAVAQPAELALQLITSRGWAGALISLSSAMPKSFALALIAFHPLPLCVGLLGVMRNPHLRIIGLSLFTFGIISAYVYHAPWTSMTAFPVVYLGAVDLASRVIKSLLESSIVLFPHSVRSLQKPLSIIFLSVIMFSFIAPTNVDLLGYPVFAQSWWQAYWSVLPY